MATYRLDVEYEGTRYRGWQFQRNAKSISGELIRAVQEAGEELVDLGGAGRTDAGVHALAQTAHLKLSRRIDPGPFREALNDRLPFDVHVLSLLPAAADFHARHSAVSRTYLYQIALRRTALAKRTVWWVKRALDPSLVEGAASRIAGLHDFRAFCEKPDEQASTRVKVEAVEVATADAMLLIRVTASHFLWKMVRRLVGSLVEVGAGALAPDAFVSMLRGSVPPGFEPAKWTAPPSGLFLERVSYPGEGPLRSIEPVAAVRRPPGTAGPLYRGALRPAVQRGAHRYAAKGGRTRR